MSGDGSKRRPPLTESVREVLEGLDTGDLVLFDRPCSKMGSVIGAIVCSTAKVVGGSPFDHIGVVVRDEDGNNILVEACFSGVAVRPLCERVRRSSASQIFVRRLQTNRTEEMQVEARRFVSEVTDVPYTNTAPGLLQMAFSSFRYHPAKERRRRMHAETVGLSASIMSLEKELAICQSENERTQVLNNRLRRALTQRRKAQVFLDDAADQERPVIPQPSPSPPAPARPTTTTLPEDDSLPIASRVAPSPPRPGSIPPAYPEDLTTSYEGGLFCSELVAALYQRLGLFDAPYPARHDYVPADFSPSIGTVGDIGGDGATKDTSDAEHLTSDRDSPPLLLDDEVRVALLRGAALDSGQWVRGGPQSPSSQTPPPVDKEDREPGGAGWGGSRSSSPPPAPSGGAAETSQPSQRLVLGCMKEPLVGEEREVLRGGLHRWLPSLQGVRLSSSNPIAFVSHFATPAPHFASFVAHSAPTPAVAQLAWLVHGFPQRAVSTATAASSSFIKEAVALTDRLTVQPRDVWRPTRNGNGIRPMLKDWVPAATTSAVSVTAERRLTTTMDESLLLSACQDCTGYSALDFTSTSAAIAAAAAAAAAALMAAKTSISARRGGRSGAVAVLLGGGGVSLALLTGGAACGLAS